MAAMTQHASPFAETRHRLATTAVLVALFWIVAAAAVFTAHTELDPISPWAGAVTTIAVIFLSAYCYTRFCAPRAGISHALGVGIAWLVLGILTEFAMTAHLGHGWYGLLGSPDRPLVRNVFLFVWIFAPVFFAHEEDNT